VEKELKMATHVQRAKSGQDAAPARASKSPEERAAEQRAVEEQRNAEEQQEGGALETAERQRDDEPALASAERANIRARHADQAEAREHRRTAESATARRVAQESEDEAALCQRGNMLNFEAADVAHSNLGGQGPDIGEENIQYLGVAAKDGRRVDLVVSAENSYAPADSTKNGVHGAFGAINLQVNTDVRLLFQFMDGDTREPITFYPFYFTVFDLDHGMNHGSREAVQISGLERYNLSEDSDLEVIDNGDNSSTFVSTLRGGKVDNPTWPQSLNSLQAHRTVTVKMAAASEFRITLSESEYAAPQGRNFFFAGPSELTCAEQENCANYDCPADYQLRRDSEFLVCSRHACGEHDRDICCFSTSPFEAGSGAIG